MPSVPGGSGGTEAAAADGGAPRVADGGPPRVIAVVVTYNRRELLLEALAALQAQTRPADAVIVVDNASADGTAAAVRRQYPTACVAELAGNIGGAGGFACGIALALDQSADLVWLMDDDTVPGPGALQALLDARARHPA
jgi:GT2 family glycosyltransferase